MRARWDRWGRCGALLWIAALVAVSPATVTAHDASGATQATRQEMAASLDPVQGVVQVRHAEADTWQTVVRRQMVAEGDWIKTDRGGRAFLRFFEGVETEIFPSSVVQVSEAGVAEMGRFRVTLDVLLGETVNRMNAAMDAEARYTVYTPTAAIAVRGTEFWTRVGEDGATQVGAFSGAVLVVNERRDADGMAETIALLESEGVFDTIVPGEPLLVGASTAVIGPETAVSVSPEYIIEPLPVFEPPVIVEDRPLAPASCGNGTCEPDEAERGSCPLDCLELPGCGDGECDRRGGEDPVTCPADCEPAPADQSELTYFHFFWGEMRCDIDPPGDVTGPVVFHWGVGCFDSAAHASAHPHPADYQLYVNGQPYHMGGLHQSGPHVHLPYCPWGWSFAMDPVDFEPGEYSLTLIETLTDTWSTMDSEVRAAGTVSQLDCQMTVRGSR